MIKKIILWSTFMALSLAVPLVRDAYGAEESEEEQGYAKLPTRTVFRQLAYDHFENIHKYLNPQDSCNLRLVSQGLRYFVEIATDRSIRTVMTHLNCVSARVSNTRIEEHLDQLSHRKVLHPELQKQILAKLEEETFLFVPEKSPLENILVNFPGHKRISLRSLLGRSSGIAFELYNTLFGHGYTDDNREVSLNHLAVCLPILGISVSAESKSTNKLAGIFFDKNKVELVRKLEEMRRKRPYFSFGMCQNEEFLDKATPYTLVVEQSQLRQLRELQLEHARIILKIQNNANNELNLGAEELPAMLRRLRLVDGGQLCHSIRNNFLAGCIGLITLKMNGFQNLMFIEDGFLTRCSGLTSLDTGAFQNVTSIGYSFLDKCSSLTSLDTKGFLNVTSIKGGFLKDCRGLTSLDTVGFQNVTSIGYDFLMGCVVLTTLDTRGFQNVTSIGNNFLHYCSSLTSLDTSPFQNLTSIKMGFLKECSGLTSLDTVGFHNVTSIGDDSFFFCSGLTFLDTSGFKNVTSIGHSVLRGCSGLTSLGTAGFQNVRSIGNYFLSLCQGITFLDAGGFQNVTYIGNGFLKDCSPELSDQSENLRKQILDAGLANAKPRMLNAIDG